MNRTFTHRAMGAAAIGITGLAPPAFAQEELIFDVFIPRPAPRYKNALEP